MADGTHQRLQPLSPARNARLVAARLHEIEGNPLGADQLAMFDMFEREGWSDERRRAFILAQARCAERLYEDLLAISLRSAARLRGRETMTDADLYDEVGLPG